jgi:Protein of unknown function (DUF1761)
MGFLAVIVAALASFAYGAVHYMLLSKPWMRASGIRMDDNGRPEGGGSALPFLLSGICMLLVAGFLRHILMMSGITEPGKALLAGLGVGAFFIAPWTMINNAYGMRPFMLTVIDGAYAIIGCGLIGLVLGLF